MLVVDDVKSSGDLERRTTKVTLNSDLFDAISLRSH